MPFSVLHISDLHRSPEDPVGNDELISTLQADMDRWAREDPAIGLPQAIIVSGDIVRGVSLGDSDSDSILAAQYDDANDFLVRLTDRVLGGDKDRVVIVPGNHDVDWNMARSAMEPVDEAALPSDLRPSSFGPGSDLRWDWRERRAFRIVDRTVYESRFDKFSEFYGRFYGRRSYEPKSYFDLFDLFGGRIGVAAFNSTFENDCFAQHGAIPDEALATAHLGLRDRGHELLMAVWHHNVEGSPYQLDYMDISTVYSLIGKGFRVGVHGHQHRAQTSSRTVQLPEQEPMALISAGSICAGRRELPTGVNRQFNVIVLADDLASARVHIREVTVSNIFAAARRPEFGGNSFVDLTWPAPSSSTAGVAGDAALLLEAEEALHAGRFSEVVGLLASASRPVNSHADALLLDALRKGELWEDVPKVLGSPANPEHLVLLVEAALKARGADEADQLLEANATRVGLPASIARDLRDRISAHRRLKT